MDTIKAYLENMFLSLPMTKEVEKAKEELYQMMEDKYYELKESGKSENEAIGTVISEFGNLDELKQEMGFNLNKEAGREKRGTYEEKAIRLSMMDVTEYMEQQKNFARNISIAVFIFICSPICLIFFGGLSDERSGTFFMSENMAGFMGLVIMFMMVIVGTGICIYSGTQMQKYDYMKKELLEIDMATERFLKEKREGGKNKFASKIIIGVAIIFMSVIPLFATGFFFEHNDMYSIFAVCLILLCVAVSTTLFIPAGMTEESYKVLLQEEEYRKMVKDKNMDNISSIYWCIVTAIYLGWSFWTFNWGVTWIIWPVAGVLFGAVAAIYSSIKK